mmetsp:Transcript_67559/g.119835  ORF Transcript_67559/g.119835 Transcript_67559/m.119835 type:complete len:472 (-) Transcript_67559:2606-4021(-)
MAPRACQPAIKRRMMPWAERPIEPGRLWKGRAKRPLASPKPCKRARGLVLAPGHWGEERGYARRCRWGRRGRRQRGRCERHALEHLSRAPWDGAVHGKGSGWGGRSVGAWGAARGRRSAGGAGGVGCPHTCVVGQSPEGTSGTAGWAEHLEPRRRVFILVVGPPNVFPSDRHVLEHEVRRTRLLDLGSQVLQAALIALVLLLADQLQNGVHVDADVLQQHLHFEFQGQLQVRHLVDLNEQHQETHEPRVRGTKDFGLRALLQNLGHERNDRNHLPTGDGFEEQVLQLHVAGQNWLVPADGQVAQPGSYVLKQRPLRGRGLHLLGRHQSLGTRVRHVQYVALQLSIVDLLQKRQVQFVIVWLEACTLDDKILGEVRVLRAAHEPFDVRRRALDVGLHQVIHHEAELVGQLLRHVDVRGHLRQQRANVAGVPEGGRERVGGRSPWSQLPGQHSTSLRWYMGREILGHLTKPGG